MTPLDAAAAALRTIPGPVGVAVSGGGDSLALLVAAHEAGADLRVATVDHGLRTESAEEARGVARICAARGVPHDTLHWRWTGEGNLSACARKGRLDALADWAAMRGVGAVLIGHTRDDVAETFLMRLSRRAGIDGLSAMAPEFRHQDTRILRPFLNVSRADLRGFLRARDIGWIDDPTNDDETFERVRARRALQALSPLGIDEETLADVAVQMRAGREALDAGLVGLVDEAVRQDCGDLVVSRTLFDAPAELVRRFHVAAVRWIGRLDYPPRRDDVARFSSAAAEGRSATLAGVRLMPDERDMRLTREFSAVQRIDAATTTPWDGRWRLDGPHRPDLTVRALGEDGIAACPDWRVTNRPRASLVATPSVWSNSRLVAAPLAGYGQGWSATVAAFRDGIAPRGAGN